jgi:hypothetical protein
LAGSLGQWSRRVMRDDVTTELYVFFGAKVGFRLFSSPRGEV